MGIEVQALGALLAGANAVQAGVEPVALPRIRARVDAVLSRTVTVSRLGGLELPPGLAPVLDVVDVVAGVFLRVLVRIKDQPVLALLPLYQLPLPALKVPVAIFRVGEEPVGPWGAFHPGGFFVIVLTSGAVVTKLFFSVFPQF